MNADDSPVTRELDYHKNTENQNDQYNTKSMH